MSALDRPSKAILAVLLSLEKLRNRGLVDGPSLMTPKGRKEAMDNFDAGFAPTQEEVDSVMRIMRQKGLIK